MSSYTKESVLFTWLLTLHLYFCIAFAHAMIQTYPTFLSVSIYSCSALHYWQHHHVLTCTEISSRPSAHGSVITSTTSLNRRAPLEKLWPLQWRKKNSVDLRDKTSLTTMLFGVAGRASCLEPRLALATAPLVLMRNHQSPLHLNVSLQPRRRHNFAAYMGPLTSKRALLREK